MKKEKNIKKVMNRQELISEINSFRDMDENWDGYGGIIPSKSTIENCLKIISTIIDEIKIFEDVYPNSNGTISIDLKTDKGLLCFEVGNKSMSYYVDIYDVGLEFRDELYLISDNSFLTSTKLLNQDLKLIM